MTERAPHVPRLYGVFVQARELDRSLSFYQDVPGLEPEWKDGTLAVLRSRGDSTHTLVIHVIGDRAVHGLGEPGVSRIAFRVMDAAGLDRAERPLTRHAVHYRRFRDADADADYLTMRDPDGLRVVLFRADQASLTAAPPAYLYWYE